MELVIWSKSRPRPTKYGKLFYRKVFCFELMVNCDGSSKFNVFLSFSYLLFSQTNKQISWWHISLRRTRYSFPINSSNFSYFVRWKISKFVCWIMLNGNDDDNRNECCCYLQLVSFPTLSNGRQTNTLRKKIKSNKLRLQVKVLTK